MRSYYLLASEGLWERRSHCPHWCARWRIHQAPVNNLKGWIAKQRPECGEEIVGRKRVLRRMSNKRVRVPVTRVYEL